MAHSNHPDRKPVRSGERVGRGTPNAQYPGRRHDIGREPKPLNGLDAPRFTAAAISARCRHAGPLSIAPSDRRRTGGTDPDWHGLPTALRLTGQEDRPAQRMSARQCAQIQVPLKRRAPCARGDSPIMLRHTTRPSTCSPRTRGLSQCAMSIAATATRAPLARGDGSSICHRNITMARQYRRGSYQPGRGPGPPSWGPRRRRAAAAATTGCAGHACCSGPEHSAPSRGRHPMFWVSSGGLKVGPGGGFVVGGAGLEAAVEDADEAVAELAECGLVAGAACAQGLVVGAGAG